jgi:hypothetical protein
LAPLELESLFGDAGLKDIQAGSVVAESRRYLPSLKVMLARRVQQAVDLVLVSSTGSPVQRFTASPLHSPSR